MLSNYQSSEDLKETSNYTQKGQKNLLVGCDAQIPSI